MKFSTRDEDNDPSGGTDCAGMHKGGWWYQYCHTSRVSILFEAYGDESEAYHFELT